MPKNIDNIPVDLNKMFEIVANELCDTFTTADVLRIYSGGFHSNIGVPATRSFNALFGKILKRHEKFLNIREIRAGVSVKDDDGRQTSASMWKRLTRRST